MNLEELLIKPLKREAAPWQLGSLLIDKLKENSIALIFCSDERGAERNSSSKDFTKIREEFYRLSKNGIDIPICDLGDLRSGNTLEDTHFILQEILIACYQKGVFPIVVGGSNDLSLALFKSLRFYQRKINYTQINSFIYIDNQEESLSEKNFLAKIFKEKEVSLNNYCHLGYQKHLNEEASIELINNIGFEALRLSEMMNTTENAEPFLRQADMVTLSSDAIESFFGDFSFCPQVNGLNRREVCVYAREVGLGEELKVMGLFNCNFESNNNLNHQLIAQILWYFLEGLSVKRNHPKERKYETFIVMMGEKELYFKKDIFTNLWYFGKEEDIAKCIPCSKKDYENAKKGILSTRFYK